MTDPKDKGYTLKPPYNLLAVAFGVEVIFILSIFFFGDGYKYFQSDISNTALLISLGMLAFISIFAFVFVEKSEFMSAFNKAMESEQQKFEDELRNKSKDKTTSQYLRDHAARLDILEEYRKNVDPTKWAYSAIFLFLIVIGFSLIKVEGCSMLNLRCNALITSIGIHVGLLFAFFLVTSVVSVILAYKSSNSSSNPLS